MCWQSELNTVTLSFMDGDICCQLSTCPQEASWRKSETLAQKRPSICGCTSIQILQDHAQSDFYTAISGPVFPVAEKPSCRSPLESKDSDVDPQLMAPWLPWRVRPPPWGWSTMPRFGRNWRSYLGRNPWNTPVSISKFSWYILVYSKMGNCFPQKWWKRMDMSDFA